jgi:uncharacterized membrane protein
VDLYGILLFVHLTSIVAWVGGGIMLEVIIEKAVASNDASRVKGLADDAETLGQRFFGPSSGIALLAGVWLVFEGGWGWGQPFVWAGLIGFALSTILGFGILVPTGKKVQEGLAAPGAALDSVRGEIVRLRNISRLDTLVLIVVIFFMTVKPGT